MTFLLLFAAVTVLKHQIVASQYVPLNYINRPFVDTLSETIISPCAINEPTYKILPYPPQQTVPEPIILPQYPVITETFNNFVPQASPVNFLPQITSVPKPSSTVVITDCTPQTCQNLANALQLMIVSNFLQNTQGGKELARQITAPVINEFLTSPVMSCGCPNPVFPNVGSPNFVSPNALPNLITRLSNTISNVPAPLFIN